MSGARAYGRLRIWAAWSPVWVVCRSRGRMASIRICRSRGRLSFLCPCPSFLFLYPYLFHSHYQMRVCASLVSEPCCVLGAAAIQHWAPPQRRERCELQLKRGPRAGAKKQLQKVGVVGRGARQGEAVVTAWCYGARLPPPPIKQSGCHRHQTRSGCHRHG